MIASRRATAGLAAAALLLAAAAAAAAPASPAAARAEARERFDRGLQLFEEGDNAGALAEFLLAHELIPNRLVLFNVGMVYAAMNRPVEAVDTLERVLADTGPLTPERIETARRTRDEQARRVALVDVVTNVPATVEIDGVQVARTPLAAPLRVAGGRHIVAALAPDHLPARREVTVAGATRAEVRLDLPPAESRLAHLWVRAAVPDAEVVVDGEVVGRTPLAASLTVLPGRRAVEVRRPGYRAARREIALGEGAMGDLTFDLEEDPAAGSDAGSLALQVSESEAEVAVDGRTRGPYRGPLRLPAGAHRIRVSRAGFEPLERTVTVPRGGETSVRVTLKPTPETRLAYVSRSRTRRRWAWIATGAGVALAGGLGALAVDAVMRLPDAEAQHARVLGSFERRGGGECDPAAQIDVEGCQAKLAEAEQRVSSLEQRRAIGLGGAALGLVAVGVGVFLLATGDDPQRYDRGEGGGALMGWLSPSGGGGAVLSLPF